MKSMESTGSIESVKSMESTGSMESMKSIDSTVYGVYGVDRVNEV